LSPQASRHRLAKGFIWPHDLHTIMPRANVGHRPVPPDAYVSKDLARSASRVKNG
jgi:hypothetical protein